MKTIGLVAHDNKKIDMVQFCVKHYEVLKQYKLYSTDGTGEAINKVLPDLNIESIGHGPDGGDVHIAYNLSLIHI